MTKEGLCVFHYLRLLLRDRIYHFRRSGMEKNMSQWGGATVGGPLNSCREYRILSSPLRCVPALLYTRGVKELSRQLRDPIYISMCGT